MRSYGSIMFLGKRGNMKNIHDIETGGRGGLIFDTLQKKQVSYGSNIL